MQGGLRRRRYSKSGHEHGAALEKCEMSTVAAADRVCTTHCVQAVGELPEERRGAVPMDTDPPSTSQENSSAQPTSTPNNGKKAAWQQRGLAVLHSPYVRPLPHQEMAETMRDGTVTDWDRWECVMHTAVRYEPKNTSVCPPISAHIVLEACLALQVGCTP